MKKEIRILQKTAQKYGDDYKYVLCSIALELESEECYGPSLFEERFGGSGLRLSMAETRKLMYLTASEAWDECARMIEPAMVASVRRGSY